MRVLKYSIQLLFLFGFFAMSFTQCASLKSVDKNATTFQGLGGEFGQYLSHVNSEVNLQSGVQGLGETFKIVQRPNGSIAIVCLGKEKGKYLSHSNKELSLETDITGESEEWNLQSRGDNRIAFEAMGQEKGFFLSHAFSKIWLQRGYQGEGELWLQEKYKK
jgi:hypothetical protein